MPVDLPRLDWDDEEPPSRPSVERRLRDEGVEPSAWSNTAGDRYAEHQHAYTKVLMCAAGSITFFIGGEPIELHPGDGFVLPPHTPHSAVVGAMGCTCLEGQR